MNELHITLGDRSYSFGAGETVRIGRSPDNDIVVSDPTVSRQHAQLSPGPGGWEFENVGRALSFLNGAPVTRALLSGPAQIQLSSERGPVLSITPADTDTPRLVPQYESPQYESPQYESPQYETPQYETPQYETPQYESRHSDSAPRPLPQYELPPPELPLPGESPANASPSGFPEPGFPEPGFPPSGFPEPGFPEPGFPEPGSGPPDRTSVLESPVAPAYPGGRDYSDGTGYPGREAPRIRPVPAPPVDEIATALHILVPIRSWLHDPGWRQFLRLLVIPYGLLPLIFIALFASSSNLSTPGWAYSLYIAPLWAIVFWLLIRPGQVERREVLIGIGAIVFALIWIRLITVHINELMGHPGRPLPFFGAIGVGINEEITKALPILLAALLLLKYRSIKLDVRMWMFLGTIVGLAFGVTEQAGYTLQDIQGITSARANNQAIVEVLAFAERVFVDGFQHAMWAGVSAFFIGIAVNYPRRRVELVAFGIAVPAILHGLYDWSAGAFGSLWIPIIIQALSLFLFLGYTMSAAAIERQVRRTPMFRGESMLMERISDGGRRPPESRPRPSEGQRRPPEDQPRPPEDQPQPAEDRPRPAGDRPWPAEDQPWPPSEDRPRPAGDAAWPPPDAAWPPPDGARPPQDWERSPQDWEPSPPDWEPSRPDAERPPAAG